jgi:hypothetical protein
MMARPIPGGCTLSLRVHPGAKRNAITGEHGDALKISVTTAASDGRANSALVGFLAKQLGVPRRSIELIAGAASRTKTLRITGITAAEVEARLLSDLA